MARKDVDITINQLQLEMKVLGPHETKQLQLVENPVY